MPVRKTKGGGYKFGTSGKEYRGKGARTKALKQARAIKASQQGRSKKGRRK